MKVTAYRHVLKVKIGGDWYLRDTELRNAVTATDGRVDSRVQHRTTTCFPRVCCFVEVLALEGLERYSDD